MSSNEYLHNDIYVSHNLFKSCKMSVLWVLYSFAILIIVSFVAAVDYFFSELFERVCTQWKKTASAYASWYSMDIETPKM